LVVNEALHHGIPCVVSDAVGCAPDLIVPGQTGDVFEVDSINHLAAVIKASLSLVGDSTIRGYCLDQISRYTVKCAAVGIANAYNRVVHIS
jgi:glycosyltransferase involved in cell wall biosynthesis